MTVRRTKLNIERYQLGSLRLYQEDLRAIAAAAAEAGDLVITCDGFEATSPDDFSALPEKLKDISITAKRAESSSFIQVQLSAWQASVELADPDTLLAGVVSRIRLICEPRRRELRSLLVRRTGASGRSSGTTGAMIVGTATVLAAAVGGVFAALSPGLGSGHVNHNGNVWTTGDIIVVTIVGLIALIGLSYAVFALRPWVMLINAPRADRPTYWQRTRDNWLVGVITALLGTIAGYLLGKIR